MARDAPTTFLVARNDKSRASGIFGSDYCPLLAWESLFDQADVRFAGDKTRGLVCRFCEGG